VALPLVECFDQYGPAFDAVERSSLARVPLAFRLRQSLECDLWQQRFARDETREPVRSDIPTLILTGEFDPVAPPEWGRRIAATLSLAFVYEIRTESHNTNTVCRMTIVAQFLADPEKEPDASCIGKLPPITFATRWP
jgi:pimeloyl-ACP methyl ester carboxylesterase